MAPSRIIGFVRREIREVLPSTQFRTVFYTFVVFLVLCLDRLVEYRTGGGSTAGMPDYMANHLSWHFHLAVQIWIFVLFFIYTSVTQLNTPFDPGAPAQILFRQRSPLA